jgi:hypothetical protein
MCVTYSAAVPHVVFVELLRVREPLPRRHDAVCAWQFERRGQKGIERVRSERTLVALHLRALGYAFCVIVYGVSVVCIEKHDGHTHETRNTERKKRTRNKTQTTPMRTCDR